MADPVTLTVLTQEGVALEERTRSIIAPGEAGYLGILANHAPLVTTLAPGKLSWRGPDGGWRARAIGEGLLEVVHNQVTILTDSVSAAESLERSHVI